mmetsp:Transcript_34515/g.72302  ORF Transcript_34515/g.72302 Transcript_34515/m.72302 type:complete len:100 (+) Transcript_34515:342-641(+)
MNQLLCGDRDDDISTSLTGNSGNGNSGSCAATTKNAGDCKDILLTKFANDIRWIYESSHLPTPNAEPIQAKLVEGTTSIKDDKGSNNNSSSSGTVPYLE